MVTTDLPQEKGKQGAKEDSNSAMLSELDTAAHHRLTEGHGEGVRGRVGRSASEEVFGRGRASTGGDGEFVCLFVVELFLCDPSSLHPCRICPLKISGI